MIWYHMCEKSGDKIHLINQIKCCVQLAHITLSRDFLKHARSPILHIMIDTLLYVTNFYLIV